MNSSLPTKRSYLALLRGVNVGGKNKLGMSVLSDRLTDLGLEDVSTVLASGNVLLRSSEPARKLGQLIESVLVEDFGLDQDPVKVLVLTAAQVNAFVEDKPDRFGDEPDSPRGVNISVTATPLLYLRGRPPD